MPLEIVILAAGQGKRMHSNLPKVLHTLAGVPILERILQTVASLNPQQVHVVYGYGGDVIPKTLEHYPVTWYRQNKLLGTAHALAQVLPMIQDEAHILVLLGDVPLISCALLTTLTQTTPKDQFGLVTVELTNPAGLGRILRDSQGNVIGIVEEKDATCEQKSIHEINTGILLGSAKQFKTIIPQLNNNNNQGEYYLTDVIHLAVQNNQKIHALKVDEPETVMGVNDRCQLEQLERYYQQHTARSLMKKGVTIADAKRFDLRGDWQIAHDVTIDVDVVLEGAGSMDIGCKIGPFVVLKDVQLGKNVEIKSHCHLEGAIIGDHCVVGPFARIRKGTILNESAHIGNFVEIKNTEVGSQSKVNHLSYLGDATVGRRVNVGAGTITCNYDGANKYRTVIEDDVFIGSDTQLIAPVIVGKGATIGAGSTITKDAPPQTLTVSRAKQVAFPNWQRKKRNQPE